MGFISQSMRHKQNTYTWINRPALRVSDLVVWNEAKQIVSYSDAGIAGVGPHFKNRCSRSLEKQTQKMSRIKGGCAVIRT